MNSSSKHIENIADGQCRACLPIALLLEMDNPLGDRGSLLDFSLGVKGVDFIRVSSPDEILQLLTTHSDVAILILGSSLARESKAEIVRSVRHSLGNWDVRIILVGEQDNELGDDSFLPYDVPAPESVASLTEKRFRQLIGFALRSYDYQIALRKIGESADIFLTATGLPSFAQNALALFRTVFNAADVSSLFCLVDKDHQQMFVIAGTGAFQRIQAVPLSEFPHGEIGAKIHMAIARGEHFFAKDFAVLLIPVSANETTLIYLEAGAAFLFQLDKRLLHLFCSITASMFRNLLGKLSVVKAHKAMVTALADLGEYRDTDTGSHVIRVARMTDEIAWVLHEQGHFPDILSNEFLRQVGTASVLHDVGKVSIPDNVLLKAAKLDEEERRIIDRHTTNGGVILQKAAEMAEETMYLKLATRIAISHHERYDGKGYPHGLKGENIPLEARILAVADVFDALTCERPYKAAWPEQDAVDLIRNGAGTQFDPHVVDAFLTVMERRRLLGFAQWEISLSVGDSNLDADHQQLINLINQLVTVSALGSRNAVEYVLDDLLRYTTGHFQREELHMAAMAYPRLAQHQKMHRKMTERVRQVRWQYQNGLLDNLCEETLTFLMDWLVHHIKDEDKKYAAHLHQTA
jgi:hemerythrin-like metal-binding protein